MTPPRLVIFDVDDVFVDMDQLAARAVEAVTATLVETFGDRGARAAARFDAHYDILRAKLRAGPAHDAAEFDALVADIQRWQRGVVEAGHDLKIWSRETMLTVALEREGIEVEGAFVHEAVGRYWAVLRDESRVFDDAVRALRRVRDAGVHAHLATNSDGNLTFDAAARTFRYDAEHARRTKMSRLDCVVAAGVAPEDITIGDPVGKPHVAFFERVLADVRCDPVPPETIWAVGDSYADDIAPLFALGASRGFWVLRRKTAPAPERVTVVTSLDEVTW